MSLQPRVLDNHALGWVCLRYIIVLGLRVYPPHPYPNRNRSTKATVHVRRDISDWPNGESNAKEIGKLFFVFSGFWMFFGLLSVSVLPTDHQAWTYRGPFGNLVWPFMYSLIGTHVRSYVGNMDCSWLQSRPMQVLRSGFQNAKGVRG